MFCPADQRSPATRRPAGQAASPPQVHPNRPRFRSVASRPRHASQSMARSPRMAVEAPRRRRDDPTDRASILSRALTRLDPSRELHNVLTPLSFLPERESQLRAPPFA